MSTPDRHPGVTEGQAFSLSLTQRTIRHNSPWA